MDAALADDFGTLPEWQEMLDRHAELFSEMSCGAAIGIVPRAGSGVLPGRHVAGLRAAGGVAMLSLRVGEQGMRAERERFDDFEGCGVDLLFVADDEALATLRRSLDGDALSAMKRLIRGGGIMFYVLRTKYQLQDAGYEDFLDSLGLAFLGACR